MIVSELKYQHLENGTKAYFATYSLLGVLALCLYLFLPHKPIVHVETPTNTTTTIGVTLPPSEPIVQKTTPSEPPSSQKSPNNNGSGEASTSIAAPAISDQMLGVNDSLFNDDIDEITEKDLITSPLLASNEDGLKVNGLGIPSNGNNGPGDLELVLAGDSEIMNNDELFIAVDKEPELDYEHLYAKLKYPSMALRNGIEGQVIISVLVGKDGRPIKFKEKGEANPIFRNAAIEAVMNAEFSPALQGDEPVLCWVTIPISFKLK